MATNVTEVVLTVWDTLANTFDSRELSYLKSVSFEIAKVNAVILVTFALLSSILAVIQKIILYFMTFFRQEPIKHEKESQRFPIRNDASWWNPGLLLEFIVATLYYVLRYLDLSRDSFVDSLLENTDELDLVVERLINMHMFEGHEALKLWVGRLLAGAVVLKVGMITASFGDWLFNRRNMSPSYSSTLLLLSIADGAIFMFTVQFVAMQLNPAETALFSVLEHIKSSDRMPFPWEISNVLNLHDEVKTWHLVAVVQAGLLVILPVVITLGKRHMLSETLDSVNNSESSRSESVDVQTGESMNSVDTKDVPCNEESCSIEEQAGIALDSADEENLSPEENVGNEDLVLQSETSSNRSSEQGLVENVDDTVDAGPKEPINAKSPSNTESEETESTDVENLEDDEIEYNSSSVEDDEIENNSSSVEDDEIEYNSPSEVISTQEEILPETELSDAVQDEGTDEALQDETGAVELQQTIGIQNEEQGTQTHADDIFSQPHRDEFSSSENQDNNSNGTLNSTKLAPENSDMKSAETLEVKLSSKESMFDQQIASLGNDGCEEESKAEPKSSHIPVSMAAQRSVEFSPETPSRRTKFSSLKSSTRKSFGTPKGVFYGTPKSALYDSPKSDTFRTPKGSVYTPKHAFLGTPRGSARSTPNRSIISTPRRSIISTPRRSIISTPRRSIISTPNSVRAVFGDSDWESDDEILTGSLGEILEGDVLEDPADPTSASDDESDDLCMNFDAGKLIDAELEPRSEEGNMIIGVTATAVAMMFASQGAKLLK